MLAFLLRLGGNYNPSGITIMSLHGKLCRWGGADLAVKNVSECFNGESAGTVETAKWRNIPSNH
jgi:hypothetical protein